MATTISAYLVHMPNRPDTHSQNKAPGPPRKIAVATPAMLPTPTVEASAVATAWNGRTLPSPPPGWVSLPSTSLQRPPEVAELRRAGDDREQDARAHEQHDHRRAPDVAVQPLVGGFNGLEHATP